MKTQVGVVKVIVIDWLIYGLVDKSRQATPCLVRQTHCCWCKIQLDQQFFE